LKSNELVSLYDLKTHVSTNIDTLFVI